MIQLTMWNMGTFPSSLSVVQQSQLFPLPLFWSEKRENDPDWNFVCFAGILSNLFYVLLFSGPIWRLSKFQDPLYLLWKLLQQGKHQLLVVPVGLDGN
jgi:hypothetical protein